MWSYREISSVSRRQRSVERRCSREEAVSVSWCFWGVQRKAFHPETVNSFKMELPESVRKGLEDFSRNVLFDQSRTLSKERGTFLPHGKS